MNSTATNRNPSSVFRHGDPLIDEVMFTSLRGGFSRLARHLGRASQHDGADSDALAEQHPAETDVPETSNDD